MLYYCFVYSYLVMYIQIRGLLVVILTLGRVTPAVFVIKLFVATRRLCCVMCANFGVTVNVLVLPTKCTYFQQACDFTWNCPQCIAKSLPFNDCSFLTNESVDTSFDNCFSFSDLPQASSGLRIAHLNCWSFLSHKDEIVQLICNLHLDVLTLSEIWLDDTVSDGEVMPAGFDYSLFRRDRHRHGGGVTIIISNNIPHCLCLDLSSGQTESLWGELYPHSKRSLLLCCAYRPPSKMDFFDHFNIECENGFRSSQKILILGD